MRTKKTEERKPLAMKTTSRKKMPAAEKKNPRARPGTFALEEIHHYQRTTELSFAFANFDRFAREIAQDFITDLHFQRDAVLALQEAAEQYLVQLLDKANKLANHAGRITISIEDLQLAYKI